MTRKFKIGDRVRVNRRSSRYHMEECSIVDCLTNVRLVGAAGKREVPIAYRVDLPPFPSPFDGVIRTFSFEPCNLIPIHEGDEPGSWESLADIYVPNRIAEEQS